MTHTYALLEVSNAAYQEVKRKLIDAGYGSAVNSDGEIDMHGIALVVDKSKPFRQLSPRVNQYQEGPVPKRRAI